MKLILLAFTAPVLTWACPMCAASSNKDQYTVPILAGFIALTAIPYLIIFRLIRKYRK